jgi:C-terminal processing protease CtpA/Prc
MIVTQDNVGVVGQQSASTNGTISEIALPGQIVVNFTGMRLLNPDESEFHGIGIVPDIPVAPTPAEFEAGIDPELNAAIAYILGL